MGQDFALQPHKGASETRRARRRRPRRSHFNPTRVRLKLVLMSWLRGLRLHFNPTRVRLKPISSMRSTASIRDFNPTRVRLKRRRLALTGRERSHFNPTRVRLKPPEAIALNL